MTCQSSPCIWRWTLIIIHYPNTSNNIPVQRCQWGNSETDKQWLYHDSISAHKPLILGTWWCKTSLWLAYKWVLLVLDNAMLKLQNRTTGIPVGIGAYRWRVHASALSKLRICHRGVMSCKVIKKRRYSCSNSKKIMSLEPTCEKEDNQKVNRDGKSGIQTCILCKICMWLLYYMSGQWTNAFVTKLFQYLMNTDVMMSH